MPAPKDPKLAQDPLLHRVLADIGRVASEAEEYRTEAILAKETLFDQLENTAPARRLVCYFSAGAGIDYSDAAPIGSMLDTVGDCERLDLMINSPGGLGEMAEKLVEMCRARCRKEFRVIVPNYAKSAATMIALGGDQIVMLADRSELGPIDPQYDIVIGSERQTISGHTFLQAFDLAQERIKEASAKGEPVVGYLQALSASTMEPAFIEHCRRGVDFSRDLAKKFLREHQLPAKTRAAKQKVDHKAIRRKANRAAENLLSARKRFSHGRLIGGEEARDDIGLHVRVLQPDSALWNAYWELYVRAEVLMQSRPDQRMAKLFVERSSTLPAYFGAM